MYDPLMRYIFWCCAIAVTLAVIRHLPRPGRRLASGTGEFCCAKCGYIICQGASLYCSECGGNLRKIGVVSKRLLPPIYPIIGVVLGAILLFPLAIVAARG